MSFIGGTTLMTSYGFATTPTLTDAYDDIQYGEADIIKIWIDNNATHLMFQIEFNNTFEINPFPGNYLFIYISTDNLTGSDVDTAGFLVDYVLWLRYQGWLDFSDIVNSSNNLPNSNSEGLGYYICKNNNHTLEIGYRLQSYSASSKGYLNITIGQTIRIRFKSDLTSDWAPELAQDPVNYVLKEDSKGGIPGFNIPLLSFTLMTIILGFLFYKKRIKL